MSREILWDRTSVLVHYHPLECRPRSERSISLRRGGSLGKTLPHVLVSALCLCAATGPPAARCAGPDTGVLPPAAGQALSGPSGPAERQVPFVSHGGGQSFSCQRMGPGQ